MISGTAGPRWTLGPGSTLGAPGRQSTCRRLTGGSMLARRRRRHRGWHWVNAWSR